MLRWSKFWGFPHIGEHHMAENWGVWSPWTPIDRRVWTSLFCCFTNWWHEVKTGTKLLTFPYPLVSKSFLYSNAFTVMSLAQTQTCSKAWQTHWWWNNSYKQIKNSKFFCHIGGVRSLSPTKLGTVTNNLEHVLATLNVSGSDQQFRC